MACPVYQVPLVTELRAYPMGHAILFSVLAAMLKLMSIKVV